MIELKRGNLLLADADALVNTVNTVGVMGKGIALQFSKAFPDNLSAYERACKANELEVGRMFVFERTGLEGFERPRYIINFPTKKNWRQPSRIEYIRAGLDALVEELNRLGISSVAVPPLGCGLGGLEWGEVLPLIEAAAQRTPNVSWQVFEPAGAPDAATMPNRTARPKMTRITATILALMDRYLVPGFDYPVSLLEIQKLVYFLVASGEKLPRINFRAANYGPYSDEVAHVLSRMDGHFILGYGDGHNRPETPITVQSDAIREAREYLAQDSSLRDSIERVAKLIEGYEDPYGMELLSTVHWVANIEDRAALDDIDLAVKKVHDWSPRKAKTLQAEHITCAWLHLKEWGWLAHGLQ